MGDMADMVNDDWPADEFDQTYAPSRQICGYCGKGPFEWRETPKGWRLFYIDTETIHSCKEYWEKG
jgi:hypothetical protein